MMDYFGKNWQIVLKRNYLVHFEAFWSIKAGWFEEPNIRRGGWSGVVKIPLEKIDDDPSFIFIKRQENHMSRTWRHPFSGIATFQKEYDNIQRFHRYQIPTLELVYFGTRSYNGNRQAIIATQDLEGYFPLDVLLPTSSSKVVKDWLDRQALLKASAKVLSRMHQHHIQHNSLYPKHIFAKSVGDGWDIRIIDLEKAKRRLFKSTAILRDLSTLLRHTLDWTTKEQLTFFKAYVDEVKLSAKSKKLWSKIQDRILSKSK
jgi:hypothetical protein